MLLLVACASHTIDLQATGPVDTGSATDSEPAATDDSGATDTPTGETTRPSPSACSRWMPLDLPGAWWVYQNGGAEIRAEVGEPQDWDGSVVSPLTISTGGDSLVQYYTCADEGLAVVGHAYGLSYATGYTLTWDPPVLFTPRALEPGMDWHTESVLTVTQGDTSQRYEVVARGRSREFEEVEVAAGRFDAVYVTLDIGLGSTAEQYLADGVGEVLGSVGTLEDYDVPL